MERKDSLETICFRIQRYFTFWTVFCAVILELIPNLCMLDTFVY